MTKKVFRRNGKTWTPNDCRALEAAARRGDPVRAIAKRLGRTKAATQQKAMRMGFSFRD